MSIAKKEQWCCELCSERTIVDAGAHPFQWSRFTRPEGVNRTICPACVKLINSGVPKQDPSDFHA